MRDEKTDLAADLPMTRKALDCGSALPLLIFSPRFKAMEGYRTPRR